MYSSVQIFVRDMWYVQIDFSHDSLVEFWHNSVDSIYNMSIHGYRYTNFNRHIDCHNVMFCRFTKRIVRFHTKNKLFTLTGSKWNINPVSGTKNTYIYTRIAKSGQPSGAGIESPTTSASRWYYLSKTLSSAMSNLDDQRYLRF